MDIDPLSLKNSFEKALRKIDTMGRLSQQRRLWIVIASDDRQPVPCEDDKEMNQHHEEVSALLHYARIGLHASHNKLK